MSGPRHPTRWHVFKDATAVAEAAVQRILPAARKAIAERGEFRIVLAGGSTPESCYRLLADADCDWTHWQVYFGDERCLPRDDTARNSFMATTAWLGAVSIPADNIHPIVAELGAEAAAQAYRPLVRAALPFDMVLLGIGEDGHTASLFPGQHHAEEELVHAVHNAPKPPPDRVSLGVSALGSAREILVLVTGAGKQAAIQGWRSGASLPVAQIGGETPVDVLLDEAADAITA